MAMKRTFSVTLILFLLVWAFTAIDRIGEERSKKIQAEQAKWVASLSSEELQFLAENPAVKAQLDEIERQIAELEAMKRGFEARALRHEDQAQRLQFEDRALLETRRHIELANENRAKADRVQQDIDRLKIERGKLLQTSAL